MKKNDSTIKLRYDSHIKVCDNEQHGSILVVGNFYGMLINSNILNQTSNHYTNF